MTPAFQVKEFLTLSGNEEGKSVKKKIQKVSTKTQFATKFCCRQENLKELLSFYNIAARAIPNSNSYTKIVGLSGEGGIGKSRLLSEFIKKVSSGKSKNILKINYSDKNNLIFQNEFENIRATLDTKIKTINKSNFPAVIILEDLHWYEAEEKKKIEKLLFTFSGELPIPYNLSVLIIVTFRITKREYNFQKFDSFEDMQLMPLDEFKSNEFIKNSSLLKKNKISKSIKEKIISLSAGIPFYIEELLKSFTVENGKEIIPDSIERLLSYKLSFIDTDVLKVLQIIAAWDGSIKEEILTNICFKLRLTNPQNILVHTGVIRVESKNGENSYSFTHDIYKNYIAGKTENYFAILIHKTIAGIFEKSHTKSEHTLFKLYFHYKNCKKIDKAYEYLENYINKIVEQREFESALQRIDELIEYNGANEKKKLEIWLLKIKCLRELIRREEVGAELKKNKKAVCKNKDSQNYFEYLFLLEEFYLLSNNFKQSFRLITIALKECIQKNNLNYQVLFQFLKVRNLNTNGRINECLKEAEILLMLSKKTDNKSYLYWANYFIANSLQTLRNYSESNKIINKCISELESLPDLKLRRNFANLKAKYYYYKCEYKNFANLLREIYIIELNLREHHAAIVTLLNLADCLIVLGEINEATEILNRVNSIAHKNNSLIFIKRVKEGFLNLYMMNEDFKKSEQLSLQLIYLYDKNDYKNFSVLYSNLIIIYFSLDNLEKAYNSYLISLTYAKKMNKISDVVVSHYNIGLAYYLSEDFSKAVRFINKSYDLMIKNIGKDFNFEINFMLAELNLVSGQFKKSLKILSEISTFFENAKDTEHKIFYEMFNKLLINSLHQKKFEEFIFPDNLISYMLKQNVSKTYKLKIIYYILLLSRIGKLKITSSDMKKIVKNNLSIQNKLKNKIILFYLNKIPT